MPAELATTLTATDAERLEQAEALVRGYCGWHIAPSREETVTLHSWGGTHLALPSLYVTEIASVTEAGTELVINDGYAWLAPSSSIARYSWAWDADVEVTFTHGYESPPADVTAIVQAIAQRAVGNPGSVVQEAAGPFSTRYAGTGASLELLEVEMMTLARYRIPMAP